MHRCLTIEEILRVIFEFAAQVDPLADASQLTSHNFTKGYQAHLEILLSIALTCKTFENPALDRLWRRQWGLENLVALLPKDQTVLDPVIGSPKPAN